MQAVLKAALAELFTFESEEKRVGAMLLFQSIVTTVKETSPSDYNAFRQVMAQDQQVQAALAKANKDIDVANATLEYWGSVTS